MKKLIRDKDQRLTPRQLRQRMEAGEVKIFDLLMALPLLALFGLVGLITVVVLLN